MGAKIRISFESSFSFSHYSGKPSSTRQTTKWKGDEILLYALNDNPNICQIVTNMRLYLPICPFLLLGKLFVVFPCFKC